MISSKVETCSNGAAKIKDIEMQIRSLHSFNCTAKQVGMPTYWSAISLGNDREPGRMGLLEKDGMISK